MSTTAKLYYYSATGRGNQLRLALSAANIPFEDVFPSCGYPPSEEQIAEWRTIGGNTTTNVPMLVLPNGKAYTQSSAILRVIARMGNLMPINSNNNGNNDYDSELLYLTDKLIADAEDFRATSYKSFRAWGASEEVYQNFITKDIPRHFSNFERQLVGNGGEYFVVKDKLSIADVCVYDAIVNFGTNRCANSKDFMESFPKLLDWVKRVESHPGISAYLKSDQFEKIQFKFDHNV